MKQTINLLVQLQECDNRIKEIMAQKMKGPLKLQELEKELEAQDRKFKEENSNLESFKIDRRKLEQEIQDFDNKIEKSNIKLANIKSNKEYTAVLKEIEDLENAKSSSEDGVLELMENVEDMESISLQNKDTLQGMREKFEKTKDEIDRELVTLDKSLKSLESERDHFCQAMDRDMLRRYNFLRERKNGQAISAVIKGVCQSCHIGIPPQIFNELKTGDTLLDCPHCLRIIYWGEDGDFLKQVDDITK